MINLTADTITIAAYDNMVETVDRAIIHSALPGLSSHPFHDTSYALRDMALTMIDNERIQAAIWDGDTLSVKKLHGMLSQRMYEELDEDSVESLQFDNIPLLPLLLHSPVWRIPGTTMIITLAAWCGQQDTLSEVLSDVADTFASVDTSKLLQRHYQHVLWTHLNFAIHHAVVEHGYVKDQPIPWQLAMYTGTFHQYIRNREQLQTVVDMVCAAE